MIRSQVVRIFATILFINITIGISFGQTKKSTSTNLEISEIDKLYEKYKESKKITLYTPHGDLNGTVYIELTNNNKPISISIFGQSENKAAISEFISNTIKMKIKQGYKADKVPYGWEVWSYVELIERGLGWEFKGDNSFQLLLRKENMYFTVDAGCCYHNSIGYVWEIETGDTQRKGGEAAEKFEF